MNWTNKKKNLLGEAKIMELWGAFRRVTHQTKTEEVVLLNNGYLTTTVPATEEGVATAIADSVIALSKELQRKEIPVLYVQEPPKKCAGMMIKCPRVRIVISIGIWICT